MPNSSRIAASASDRSAALPKTRSTLLWGRVCEKSDFAISDLLGLFSQMNRQNNMNSDSYGRIVRLHHVIIPIGNGLSSFLSDHMRMGYSNSERKKRFQIHSESHGFVPIRRFPAVRFIVACIGLSASEKLFFSDVSLGAF